MIASLMDWKVVGSMGSSVARGLRITARGGSRLHRICLSRARLAAIDPQAGEQLLLVDPEALDDVDLSAHAADDPPADGSAWRRCRRGSGAPSVSPGLPSC